MQLAHHVFVVAASASAIAVPAAAQQCLETTQRAYVLPSPTPGLPYQLADFAVGDVDGDGWADVLAANPFETNLAVLRSGPGGFAPAAPIALGHGSSSIALHDLEPDGDLDLVARDGAQLDVHLNTGGGAYSAPIVRTLPAGSNMISFEFGDVDGDGDADIVAALWQPSAIAVFRNEGGGTFAAAVVYASDSPVDSVALGDVDLDGDLDVVAGRPSTSVLSLHVNAGNGTYAPAVNVPGVPYSNAIALADVDTDGDLDIVAGDWVGDTVSWIPNLGANVYGAPIAIASVVEPDGIAVADMDADGDDDLVIDGKPVTWLANLGGGAFATVATTQHASSVGALALHDVDRDLDLDLVGIGGATITVVESVGGTLRDAPRFATGVGSWDMEVAELNGDSRLDAAVVSVTDGRATILIGQDDGTFVTSASIPTGVEPRAIACGDLDGDGDSDLVVANGGSASVSVLVNNGAGAFALAAHPATARPEMVELADLDMDGDLDLYVGVIVNGSFRHLEISRNAGNGTFGAPTTYSTPWMRAFVVEDFDGDGDADVALVGGLQTHSLVLLLNDGAGGLVATPTGVSLGYSSHKLAAGDFDADGDVDLAVSASATLSTLLNDGAAGFTYAGIVAEAFAYDIALEDLDGDSDLDALAATTAGLMPCVNDGTGVLVASLAYPAGGTLVAAAARDVDGDGDLEYLGLLGNRDALAVIRGCDVSGRATCFGDGSGSACPCGNTSAPGDRSGCLNSLGSGGKLVARGDATLASDGLELVGTQMTNSTCLYFQGATWSAGGAGVAFGDGLRCAAGATIRIGQKANVGGSSRYPTLGDPPVSVRGLVPSVGGTRTYQTWYRNSAPFCTSATFNATNGVAVTWIP